jgi:integrase
MAFRMARLRRKKSGVYSSRISIPEDVRSEYQDLYGRAWEELFGAPASETASRAKVLFSEWHGEIDNRIASIRAKQRGEGRDLTHREAQALAGQWYSWYVSINEDNPGDARHWHQLGDLIGSEVMGATPEWDAHDPFVDQSQRGKEPEVREDVHPMLADEAKTAQFLASKGEALTPAAMVTFLDCILPSFSWACELLESRARGDYTPDTRPQSFPAYSPRKRNAPSKGAAKSALELFEAYVLAVKPAVATVDRWRAVFTALDGHLAGRDVEALADDDAQQWMASLITSKRGARTVKDIWLSAAHTVFEWARKQKRPPANPFADVEIAVPRKRHTRETKEFSAAEQALIFRATLAITDMRRPFPAACRWVPWLCAYSGARAGEITQLRGRDIEQRDGFVSMQLTPDAGSIKASKPRTVPIHEHVIEQGFLEYVRVRGKGPLFYTPEPAASGTGDVTNPKRPRAVKTRERVASWVRSLGVTDPEVSPTHAWRHTFKRRAARAKIEKGIRDAICGHAPKAVGDEYETPTVDDMAAALRQFPRYEV